MSEKYLSKVDILNANDRLEEIIDVPEWGGKVRLLEMSGEQRDRWEQMCLRFSKGEFVENLRASLIAFCLVDENKQPLFTINEIKQLGTKSGKTLDRIFQVCQRLNALTSDDVKELEKNSETLRIGSSVSG